MTKQSQVAPTKGGINAPDAFTARVRCSAVTIHDAGRVVSLVAVHGGEDNPNLDWAKRNPMFKAEISITQPAALARFQHDDEFDVVFVKRTKEE